MLQRHTQCIMSLSLLQDKRQRMLSILFILLLFCSTDNIQIGTIRNVVITGTSDTLLMNRSLEECLCVFYQANGSMIALNYYGMNATCELFTNYSTVWQIVNSSDSAFIFLNLPSYVLTESTAPEEISKHIYFFQQLKFTEK